MQHEQQFQSVCFSYTVKRQVQCLYLFFSTISNIIQVNKKANIWSSRLLQSSSCSPGCVHLRQPGVRSPRGTNCNVDVRGRRLASAGGGTYPQKCCCSSEAECLQIVIRRLIVAKLRFLNCTNPHVSNEYAHVAFQLIRKLKRIAAPHFCSTFFGGRKGLAFLCLDRIWALLPRQKRA